MSAYSTTNKMLLFMIAFLGTYILPAALQNNPNRSCPTPEACLFRHIEASTVDSRPTIRPILNSSRAIDVELRVSLIQILDFDDKNQQLKTLVWKMIQWHDEFISWDPEEFGGLQDVRLPAGSLWVPDVVLWNNADALEYFNEPKNNLVAYHTGKVIWIPSIVYKSTCRMDMTHYPFDTQICKLKFGSWTYDARQITIHFRNGLKQLEMERFIPNEEWKIVENTAVRNSQVYDCCEIPFMDITYTLTLQRRITFHLRLILVPTMLLSVMSVCIFWIPLRRPDRTGYGLSLFSSFLILLITLRESSPPTAQAKLGEYYVITILLVFLGILLSLVNINLCNITRDVPQWIQIVIKRLTKWLFLRCETSPPQIKASSPQHVTSPTERWENLANVLDRCYFIIFVIVLIISFFLVFPAPATMLTLGAAQKT